LRRYPTGQPYIPGAMRKSMSQALVSRPGLLFSAGLEAGEVDLTFH
jgi:hypothetical protein